jgi:hypothetical protein
VEPPQAPNASGPTEPPPAAAGSQAQIKQPSTKKKSAPKKKTTHIKKKPVVTKPAGEPKKVVVRQGSTADPQVQFTPGMSQGQAYYQKQTTEQLLAGTEANLKTAATRLLQPSDHDSVEQIRTLVDQAKLAITQGDLQRARTLATKAQLLSNELLQQQH